MWIDGLWCKVCSGDDTIKYGDTCWAVTPSDDRNRDCGCNSGGWNGEGIYYGGWPGSECNWCNCWGGGFVGHKTIGERKGGLNSIGFNLSMIFVSYVTDAPTYQPSYQPSYQPTGIK